MFDPNTELTEDQLKEVADELKIDVSEVKEMVKRAKGLVGFAGKSLKEGDGLKSLFKGMKNKLDNESEEEKQERKKRKKQKRATYHSDDNIKTKEFSVQSFLEIPPHARQAALDGMNPLEKIAFMKQVNDLTMAMNLPYRPVSTDGVDQNSLSFKEGDDFTAWFNKAYAQHKQQNPGYQELVQAVKSLEQAVKHPPTIYDAFTSQTLNTEMEELQTALKEEGPKQGRVVNIYDWFTDPNLNKGQLNFVGKEEQEAIEEQHNAAFDLFTSKELNGQVKDNRPKTGNDAYDWFTSQNLNQGAR